MTEIIFNNSDPYTIGVELEFQVLDPETLNLVARGPAILAAVPAGLQDRIKQEFICSMIEVNTDICRSVPELARNLEDLCHRVEGLAEQNNCLLYAASLHPFARSADQVVSSHERYNRIMTELQIVGRRFITQGLHLHIGLPDGETAIRVCDNIRFYLPVLLALTASSPFYEGQDTGLCSYRAKLFEALPLAGMPDHMGSWDNFNQVVTMLFQTGIINQVRDIWWDVRPHPDFGTVEVRICDLPSRFSEIIAMAALIQALVVYLAKSGNTGIVNMQVLRSNRWQAARYGFSGSFVEPLAMRKISLAEAAQELIDLVSPIAEELGSSRYFEPLAGIVRQGTSADRQRLVYKAEQDLSAVIATLQKEFWQ